jgi:hypothetical protein
MNNFPKAIIALSTFLMLSAAHAGTTAADTSLGVAAHQLVSAQWSSSKIETTKAWLKRKKTETTRLMGRQKQKLKKLAD